MSKFETTFKAAIAQNERRILIDSLRSSPELTIGEIHRLSKGGLGRLFNEITISDLMGGKGGQAAQSSGEAARGGGRGVAHGGREATASESNGGVVKPRRGRPPKSEAVAAENSAPQAGAEGKQQRRGGKAKAVNTRTAEGRGDYDEALFQAVKDSGGPAGAGSLIARAGGSSLQARAGLARLIEAGRINWSGKARGTKYSVA